MRFKLTFRGVRPTAHVSPRRINAPVKLFAGRGWGEGGWGRGGGELSPFCKGDGILPGLRSFQQTLTRLLCSFSS